MRRNPPNIRDRMAALRAATNAVRGLVPSPARPTGPPASAGPPAPRGQGAQVIRDIEEQPLFVQARRRFNDNADPHVVYHGLGRGPVPEPEQDLRERENFVHDLLDRLAENNAELQGLRGRLQAQGVQIQYLQTSLRGHSEENERLRVENGRFGLSRLIPEDATARLKVVGARVANRVTHSTWRDLFRLTYLLWRVSCIYYHGFPPASEMAVDIVSMLLMNSPWRVVFGAAFAVACVCALAPGPVQSHAFAPFDDAYHSWASTTFETADWFWSEEAETFFANASAPFVLRTARSILFDIEEVLYHNETTKPQCYHVNMLPYRTHSTCLPKRTMCFGIMQPWACIPQAHVGACEMSIPTPGKEHFDEWLWKRIPVREQVNRTSDANENSSHTGDTFNIGHDDDSSASTYDVMTLITYTACSTLVSTVFAAVAFRGAISRAIFS